MFYTTEEAAIVCGFLDLYLNRDSVDQTVREQNQRFQRGAARGDLRREDYQWAEKALDFLQPCWWQSHEDHRAAKRAAENAFAGGEGLVVHRMISTLPCCSE